MNPSIFRFSLDFHRTQSQVSIPVFLGDTGVEFHITLSDGVRAYTITDGCLAKLSIKRPTGTRIEEFCAIRDNATIVYSFMQNENTAAVEGTHECDITLYDTDGGRVGTARFTMVVSERVVRSDDIVLTDDDFTAVNAMLAAEAKRQEDFKKIAEAEAKREEAEQSRVEAEAERVSAGEVAIQAVNDAKAEAERAKGEANRAKSEADRAEASVNEAVDNAIAGASAEASRATTEANRAKSEADRAVSSVNSAVETAVAEAAQNAAVSATEKADEQIAQRVAELGTVVQTTGDSPTAVMSQKATTDVIDELATTQKKLMFGGDISATTYKEVACDIPVGTYHLHIDAIESSDTDSVYSMVLLKCQGATANQLRLDRNTSIDMDVVVTKHVDAIAVYASTDYAASVGDTVSVKGIKITADTVIGNRLSGTETIIKNGLLHCVNADTVAWVNKTVYYGQYNDSAVTISTPQVFMPAGTTINFDNLNGRYLFRVTAFDLNKSYLRNTGSFTALDSYLVEENCYIAISMEDSTASKSDLTMGNSTRVKFIGYVETDFATINKIGKMLKYKTMQPVNAEDVRWSQTTVYYGEYNPSPDCISCDPFLALAGSTIEFSDKYKIRVTEFDLDKKHVKNTGTYALMDAYNVGSDCYIAIGLEDKTGTAIPITEGNSTNVMFEGYMEIGGQSNENIISDIRENTFNNVYSDIEDVFATPLSTFASHADSVGVVEPFVFFTDPHVFVANDYSLNKYMSIMSNIQRLYNNSSANFIVCGGDWFSYSSDRVELCEKLGYIKGTLQNMFKNAYTAAGNHDIAIDGSTSGEWFLNTQSLANALYGGRKCYYSFDGANTKCYVLDTGYDHESEMTDYRWEQIDWLAERFKTDDAEHSLMFLHIGVHNDDLAAGDPITDEHIHSFAKNIADLVSAYNSKTSVTLNGKRYDFSSCSGKMHCMISGHTHFDFNYVYKNVPIVGTIDAQRMVGGVPSFDMCVADYGSNKLYLTRVGSGSNRVVDMA